MKKPIDPAGTCQEIEGDTDTSSPSWEEKSRYATEPETWFHNLAGDQST